MATNKEIKKSSDDKRRAIKNARRDKNTRRIIEAGK